MGGVFHVFWWRVWKGLALYSLVVCHCMNMTGNLLYDTPSQELLIQILSTSSWLNPNEAIYRYHDKICCKGFTAERTLLKLQCNSVNDPKPVNDLSVTWDVRVNVLLAYREGKDRIKWLPVSKAEHTLISIGLSIRATNWTVVPWTRMRTITVAVRLGKTGTKKSEVTPLETGFCSCSEESWHAQKKGVQRELA